MRTLPLKEFVLAVAVVLMSTGCLTDENYEVCEFPPLQQEACVSSAGVALPISCVTEHPECLDNYCVSYEGSQPFCSMACDTDEDCPAGGVCKAFSVGCTGEEEGNECESFCVKPSALSSNTEPTSGE